MPTRPYNVLDGQGCQAGTEPEEGRHADGKLAGDAGAPRGVWDRPASIERRRQAQERQDGAGARRRRLHRRGVYEIGALRALDLLAVNSTVNSFDVYIGTSAGAFIAALSANGVTPEEMMRVVTRQGKPPFKDINISDLLRPNLLEFARKGATMPLHVLSVARQLVAQRGAVSAMDLVMGLTDVLPSGLYTGSGIERYLREVLSEPGRTDSFKSLDCELYLTATDLDTCERIVLGAEGTEDVPISTAVRASGALPMVYAPVKVGDRELIDGGIVSTTNLDLAVEAGAKLIVVINPIVPYVNDFESSINTLRGKRPRRVSDMGFAQIGYQVFKLVAHQRLHELAKSWEDRYPGVDIVLIEPDPTDELMFQTSMMSFTSRVEIARHGFESVTKKLAGEYERYHDVAERHGLDISAKRVRQVVAHFDEEAEEVSAWRKILEGTTGALLRQASSG